MTIVRWTNLICGGLLLVAALGFLTFLPANMADYAREPEDVWIGGSWTALLGLLAALCFANAWRSNEPPRVGWRAIANFVAFISLTVLLVLGRDDPTVPPLLTLCALGPVVALIGAWRQMRFQQR